MRTRLLATFGAAALLAAACTSTPEVADVEPALTTVAPTTQPTTTFNSTTTRAPVDPQGVVRVIRPDHESALVSSSIVMVLLEEVGYEVEEFATERGSRPDYLYGRLANDEADLTLDMWPRHQGWIDGGGPLGEVGELVTVIDQPHQPAGGLQGFLITKSWADENRITHLGQINDDPALASELDADGDGLGEIYGCPEEWTCDDIIHSFIFFNEWTSLEQVQGVFTTLTPDQYSATFADFLDRVDRDEAAVAYVWTPTRYFAEAAIGEKTVWLSVSDEAAVNGAMNRFYPGAPDPNLLNEDGSPGFTDLAPSLCTQGPDGCQLGWVGSDIRAAANAEWLAENPTAHALLEAVVLDTAEVSMLFAELEKFELDDWPDKIDASMGIAREWVEVNADRADQWVDAALDVGTN